MKLIGAVMLCFLLSSCSLHPSVSNLLDERPKPVLTAPKGFHWSDTGAGRYEMFNTADSYEACKVYSTASDFAAFTTLGGWKENTYETLQQAIDHCNKWVKESGK